MPEAQASGQHDSDALISATENRRMFDTIAPRYDLMNRLLSMGLDRWWRRLAVRALAPESGKRYLDLGCGTGDMAFAIARMVTGSTVVGIDPAERMLRIARRRLAGEPSADISFRAGDATSLDLSDATLAGVITAFCVRNITHRRLAWHEILRALVPGGRLVILELTRPRGRIMCAIHGVYTRRFVPVLARLFTDTEAYRYLVDSIDQFASPEDIVRELIASGFESPVVRPLTGGAVTIFVARKPLAPQPQGGIVT